MGLFAGGAVLWIFAGFGVFWLRTGASRIGDGATFTLAGDVVWMGPLVAWVVACMVGPRGPLRALWPTPGRLTLDPDGVSWTFPENRSGSCSWDELGGISSGVDRRARWRSLRSRDGGEIATLPGPFVDETTGRDADLPMAVLRFRPDLFEALDPPHPERACVRRASA